LFTTNDTEKIKDKLVKTMGSSKFLKILISEDPKIADAIRNNDKNKIKITCENNNDIDLLDESLFDRFGNCLRGNFDEKYKLLKQWIDINKKLPVYHSNNYEEQKLGKWCTYKRMDKKHKKLSIEHIKMFEKLPYWYWDYNDIFLTKYGQVKQWIIIHKKIPSHGSKDKNEKQLGKWCAHRRDDKKINKLSDEYIKLLEELPYWYWTVNDIFNQKYEQVKQWTENTNNLPRIHSNDIVERNLGLWCHTQRFEYKKDKLSDEYIKVLEKIPYWFWAKEDPFDDMYEKFKNFILTNKRLPSDDPKNKYEHQLSKWCVDKRQNKKNNKLSNEKIQKLELLPYWYWKKEDPFDNLYEQIKQFFIIYKKLPNMISKNSNEKKLGIWCNNMRIREKQGKLSLERIAKLELLPYWYWSK